MLCLGLCASRSLALSLSVCRRRSASLSDSLALLSDLSLWTHCCVYDCMFLPVPHHSKTPTDSPGNETQAHCCMHSFLHVQMNRTPVQRQTDTHIHTHYFPTLFWPRFFHDPYWYFVPTRFQRQTIKLQQVWGRKDEVIYRYIGRYIYIFFAEHYYIFFCHDLQFNKCSFIQLMLSSLCHFYDVNWGSVLAPIIGSRKSLSLYRFSAKADERKSVSF